MFQYNALYWSIIFLQKNEQHYYINLGDDSYEKWNMDNYIV